MKRTSKDDFNFGDFDFGETNFGDFSAGDLSPESEEPEKNDKKEAEPIISATLQSFKDRVQKEQKRFEKATDTEYWFCVYFQSRDEKESFLKNAGLLEAGDKYLDGWDVSKKLGIAINKDVTGYPKSKTSSDFSDMV
jgi:hypothetical protein